LTHDHLEQTTMSDALTILTIAGALGSGLVGGVFFAFSTFVMRALARLAPPDGIAAMQAINVTVITPLFMLALFGTAVLGAVLAVWGALELGQDHGPYLLAGGALYVAGVVGTTMTYNVPRNDALAAAGPRDPAAAELWERYLSEWTAGNHVRTVAGLAAAVLLMLAIA
jgi:uncharacterized membrane protein